MELNDIWDLIVNNFVGFLLVFLRVTGIFTFNPIFSRTNVPNRIKVGASLALSVTMLWTMGGNVGYNAANLMDFVATCLKEMLVGLVLGFLVNLILTVIIYAGDLIDTQVGFSMAKAMDPSTGVTMSIFANVYYYIFVLYFFITGGHLSYIKLFSLSYELTPIGYSFGLNTVNLSYVITCYLGTVLTLAVKFAFPIIASQLITEFAIGVMMKAVPTIQIFVVNIQLKIIVGMMVLLAVSGPMSDFLDKLLGIMFDNLYSAVGLIGGSS